MHYEVVSIPPFDRQLKRLSKKYPSLKNDLAALGEGLVSNPTLGTSLGNNCFKIRLAITSKGKGKSGGARVITHFYVSGKVVFLLSIYDKSEVADISDKEIADLLQFVE
jgi:hypothetical protein